MSSAILVMVLFLLGVVAPINGLNAEIKDENLVPGGDGSGIKCTMCTSCENPCNQRPPPPPPSPPPPPASPSKKYCPPPPYIYVTGPPGALYPYDPYYNGANGNSAQFAVVFGCSLLSLMVFLRI